MLYLIYMANHPELTYRGGQEPIVHLEADLQEVVAWAAQKSRRWAFTLSNAGARYTEFRCDLANLHEINWSAIAATDFRSADVKEGKQAEFLMHHSFPWSLIRRVGVRSRGVLEKAATAVSSAGHKPKLELMPTWYY